MPGRTNAVLIGSVLAGAWFSACSPTPTVMVVRARLLDAPAAALLPPGAAVDTMRVGRDLRRTVRLSTPASLRFQVAGRTGDVLSFGIVVRPLTARVALRVWGARGSARRLIHEETLHDQRPWVDRAVTLAGGDAAVELDLSGDAADVGVSEPMVLGAGGGRPNVVIYVVDCLRADRVGAYGYTRPVTPAIDRLAAESHVFERAFACAGWTKPSVGCLLTGLDAPKHGARTVGASLDPGRPTLASLLGSGGYTTAAFVANPVLEGRGFGYAKGFDQYVELAAEWQGRAVNNVEADAAEITAAAIPWLDAHRDRPFFIYLHSLDLHYPYRERDASGGLIRAAGRASDSDRYDGELEANDREIGRLLGALEARGLDGHTHVILTADHGEEFGEHGAARHGRSLFDEILRIPLILRVAGSGAHSRIASDVSNIDVAPTVLDLAGQSVPDDFDGVSVRPLLEGRTLGPRTLFAEEITADAMIYAARRGPYKVIREVLPTRREVIFDLANDPAERRDLAADAPAGAGRLKAELDVFVQSAQAGHHVVLADAPPGREMRAEITSAGRIVEMFSLRFETGDVTQPLTDEGAAIFGYGHAGQRRAILVRTDPEDAPLTLRLFENHKMLPGNAVASGSAPGRRDPPSIRAWTYRVQKPAGIEALSPESLERMRALGYVN